MCSECNQAKKVFPFSLNILAHKKGKHFDVTLVHKYTYLTYGPSFSHWLRLHSVTISMYNTVGVVDFLCIMIYGSVDLDNRKRGL